MQSPVKDKSFMFAVEIIKFCTKLKKEDKEYVLWDQLMKSGTSIWANIAEWQSGQSKRDFLAKMYISLKESKETDYRLDLLRECWNFNHRLDDIMLLKNQNLELIKMLTSITKTTVSNISD